MLGFIVLFLVSGLLFVGISIPMIQRKVKPNPWYGFRTPKTLSNEKIWYAANEYCGRLLFIVGGLIALASVILVPLGWLPFIGKDGYALACTAVLLGGLVWAVVRSFRYLNKL